MSSFPALRNACALALLSSSCLGVQAQAVLRCDACTTAKAERLILRDSTLRHTYAVDMVHRELRHFYRPHHRRPDVDEIALTPQVRAYWELALRYYDGNRGSFSHLDQVQLDVSRSGDGPLQLRGLRYRATPDANDVHEGNATADSVSATALAQSPHLRAALATTLTQALRSPGLDIFMHLARYTHMTPQALHTLFGADDPASMAFQLPPQTLLVETAFPDGSTARWAWHPGDAAFRWVAHSARDAQHRFIDDQTATAADAPSTPVLAHLDNRTHRCRWSSAMSTSGYLSQGVQHSIEHLGCLDE